MPRKKLLIVDDDELVRQVTREALGHDFDIFEAFCAEETLTIIDRERPEVVLLELKLNGVIRGWEILTEIRIKSKDTVVIMTSKIPMPESKSNLSKADGYLVKPFRRSDIYDLLTRKGIIAAKAG